jgi:GAF domain-containing protein
MTSDERLQTEASRIEVLLDLHILDTENAQSFDNLTNFAASLFDVPIVAVSLVDIDRQWFKSSVGLNVCETSRDIAFCDHVVRDADVLNVPDTHQDIRFGNNPLVTDASFIRSYLGYPLCLDGVHILGTLCLIDTKVRHYTEEQIRHLGHLAGQVESLIQLHKMQRSYQQSQHALELQVHDVSRALARYDALLDKAAAGIISIDERGKIQSANTKLLALLGYEERELLGQNVKILMPQAIATSHDTYLDKYQRG